MLPAANQVRDLGRDLGREGTAVGFDPLFHLVVRAWLPKFPSHCDCELLEWGFHVENVTLSGIVK